MFHAQYNWIIILPPFMFFFFFFLNMQDWALSIPSPLVQEETRKQLIWELRDLVSFPGSNTNKQWGLGQVPPRAWASIPSALGTLLAPGCCEAGHVAKGSTRNQNTFHVLLSVVSACSCMYCLKLKKGQTQGWRKRSHQILSKIFPPYILKSYKYGGEGKQGFGPRLDTLSIK